MVVSDELNIGVIISVVPTAHDRVEREQYGANSVRPGLTGWAQIHGRDELPIRQKAELDGYYVHHIQLKMDLECLWRTAGAVLRQDGIHEGRLEKQQMKGAKEAVKVGK